MVAQMCLVALVLEMSVGDKTSIIDCGEACDGSAAGRLDRERRENSNKALSSLVNFSNQQSFKFYQVEVEQFVCVFGDHKFFVFLVTGWIYCGISPKQ
jgi:hypothetical protein